MHPNARRTQEGSHRPCTAREALLASAAERPRVEARAIRALVAIEQTDLTEHTMRYTCAHCGHDSATLESARDHDCSSEDGPTVVRETPA
jgi:hypothetical protein